MNKEDLQALRNAYAIAVEDNRILKDRLEKIKEMCQNTLAIMNNDSGTYPYADGRCVEAENVLKIIEGAEE